MDQEREVPTGLLHEVQTSNDGGGGECKTGGSQHVGQNSSVLRQRKLWKPHLGGSGGSDRDDGGEWLSKECEVKEK